MFIVTDINSLSANSRVLVQKAKSFRDDLKQKIIRRSPSNQRDRDKLSAASPSSKCVEKTSPKDRKKLNRGSSFKEETQTEKINKQTVPIFIHLLN